MTLGWPLRGPRVAQASPNPKPNQAEGRNPPLMFWLNADGWPLIAKFSMIDFRSHPEALPDYSFFLRPNQ